MTRIAGVLPDGPSPGGPYSASVRIGSQVAVAGQCGYLPDRSLVAGVAAQTQLAMHNLTAALQACGAGLDDVIAVQAFLTDTDHFAEFNAAYERFFTEPCPARTTIYCGLRPGVLVVPVGGGGLIAGCATAAKGLHPGIRMIGVEPEAGDDTKRSLHAGRRITIDVPHTIADGQAAATPGELTFAVNQRLVETIALVTDDEIRHAIRFAFERLKIVIEPSGATGLAALLARRIDHLPKRIGVIISGGNVDTHRLAELCGR